VFFEIVFYLHFQTYRIAGFFCTNSNFEGSYAILN